MLLNAFFWYINNITKKLSSFNMSSASVIAFIKGWNRHQMKNSSRYKGNTNNTSVTIFFNPKSKTPSDGTLLGRTPEEVFVVLHFISFHFCILISFLIFILLLFFICRFSSFTFAFRHHTSPFRGLSPSFYTHFILSAQLITEWFATLSFSTIPGSSYRERYGFEWAFFTHRRFLPYAPSPTFLTRFCDSYAGRNTPFRIFRLTHGLELLIL